MPEKLTPRTGQEDCTSCKWGEWDSECKAISCAKMKPDTMPALWNTLPAHIAVECGLVLLQLHGLRWFGTCPCYERGEPNVKGEDMGRGDGD